MICAGCGIEAGDASQVLICQLRVPKSVSPNPKATRVDVVTSSGAEGTFLWDQNQKVQKEDGQFLIFEPRYFSLDTDSRRALIVDDRSTPQQIFRLHLPRSPKVQDWSEWRHPDFLVRGDAGWAFIYNQKMQGIITNVPPDSFELRYKIETREFGH
jgi:hypothetical protein